MTTKRFSARKIKITSYSRQGWSMNSRESFAVYDSNWKLFPRHWSDDDASFRAKHMYVDLTEWNNKKFVTAIADYLNETIGQDMTAHIDGYQAAHAVLMRDLGYYSDAAYHDWCEKFGNGFRPVAKWQKV